MQSEGVEHPKASEVPGPGSMPRSGAPGERTLSELDNLLSRAAAEVQRGLDEGNSRIGRYTLVTTLGEGGFGTVWLASQEEPVRRLVALKLFRRDPASRMVLARFQNERQALAKMDHPNVASVLDAGITEDGRPWFVMPYIDGLPITAMCDEGRMPLRDRVRLLAEVCDGVQHAHIKGIIHRDLKPGNILLQRGTDRPVPKVIDFGVAKALEPADEQSQRTADGQRLGTPQYMPPEQWLHGAGVADARSDVYSLGAVLGELLVGGPPTRVPRSALDVPEVVPPDAWYDELCVRDPEVAARVAAARASTPAELAAGIHGDLDAIVRKATAAHPEDRYATPHALALDLRRWLDGMPVAARLLAPWERVARFVRRQRMASGLAAVAAIATAVALVVWAVSAAAERQAREEALEAELQSQRTFTLAKGMIEDLIAEQRRTRIMVRRLRDDGTQEQVVVVREPKGDAGIGRERFRRIERLLDDVAEDDPLTSGRLAAIVARGHLESWNTRLGFALVDRALRRVLEHDPDGRSVAFAELLPEYVRLAAKHDRVSIPVLAPMALRDGVGRGTPASVDPALGRALIVGRQPWPFYRDPDDPSGCLLSAQMLTAGIPDPIEANRELAANRVASFVARDNHPSQIEEVMAAVDYLRRNCENDDERLLVAETFRTTMMSIHGLDSEELLQIMAMNCIRVERVLGTGSPRTANAYWNMAYSCVHLGRVREAHAAYIRFLWPEYFRQSPKDGMRSWYLAYFAPVAFSAGDYDNAYAAAMTQLADAAEQGMERGTLERLSASVLSGVLAIWGDEAGASEVERDFGVVRMREGVADW